MILLVDNYDSFTYNLAHLFQELGAEVTVIRNDAIDADEAERMAPSQLVISPGPGRAEDAGATVEIVRRLGPTRADARRLPRPPGDRRRLRRRGRPGAPAPAREGERDLPRRAGASSRARPSRSRAAATTRSPRPRVPDELEVCATSDDGEVMAVRHRELPGRRHPVPPGVGAHARRAAARPQLPGGQAMTIQEALARLLEGRDLTPGRGARGHEPDHGRRGDAGPDGRLPRRAAAQGRDAGRDRRLRRGHAGARPLGAAEAHGPRRHGRDGRRRRADVQHLHRGGARGRGGGRGRGQARQPRGLLRLGLGRRARGARLPARASPRRRSSARSTSSASASSSRRRTTLPCATPPRCGASSPRARSSTCSAR